MGKTIIVGAGVTGREVASRVNDPVVIESEVDKATELRRSLGDVRVVVGDGTDERTLLQAGIKDATALVVAMNHDRDSYQCVLNSKPYKNLRKIIVVVRKPEEAAKFQRLGVQSIIIPDLATASEVLNVLQPSQKRISEIVITKGAEAIDQRLDDLTLPWNTSVIGVMRGEKLLSPTGDFVLDCMDVVHVSADVEELNAVRNVFLGDHRQLLPFSKLLVPVMDGSWFDNEFTEALNIGMFCQAGVVGMFGSEEEWLVEKARELAEGMGVPFHPLEGFEMTFESLEDAVDAASQIDVSTLAGTDEEDIVKQLRKERDGMETHRHMPGEEMEVDLLVLRAEMLRMLDRLGKRPVCVRTAEDTNIPMIVARYPEPYQSVLFMLDGSPRSNNIASLALRISIAFGCKVTALTTYEEEAEVQRMIRHIRRTGEMYGLEVVEDEVEGNPTLEFVSLVKSGNHDLTLVNRACKTVKRDIIRRVYMEAPKSVVVI